jgi:hypothetical protein
MAGCSDEGASPSHQAVQARSAGEHEQLSRAVQTIPVSVEPVRTGPDWQQTVHHRITDGQYRIRTVDDGVGFRASNQAHGLRARFGPRDVRVTNVSNADDNRTLLLGLARWGRGGDMTATGAGELALGGCPDQAFVDPRGECIGRVEIRRDGITEWWHNRPDGLEQGFTIDRRPAGTGPVVVEMAVEAASVEIDEDGQAADFAGDAGWTLRYDKLRAWDARGTTLATQMVPTPGGLAVQVDDTGAHYPIFIDPLLTSPGWTAESDQQSASFGRSVSSAGDVNADGFDDVIVGSDRYDNGQPDEGRAFVYLGSAGGLATSPAWTAESDQINALFGGSVSRAGDVNGDRASDLIVGAPGYNNGQSGEGRAFVYHGDTGNRAPLAVDDTATTEENTPVTVDVLANDTDPDGDVLTVTVDSAPSSGTTAVNADDTITYTPSTNVTGIDSLTYTVDDSAGGTDSAAVTVTVIAAGPCQDQCGAGQACYAGTCFETCTDDDCSNPDDVCYDQRCASDPCEDVRCAVAEVCIEGACTDEARGLHVTGGGLTCATSPTKPLAPSSLPWGLLAVLFAAAGWRSAGLR